MNTEIIKIQPGDGPVSEEDDAKLKAAGEILRRGGLVAISYGDSIRSGRRCIEPDILKADLCSERQTLG